MKPDFSCTATMRSRMSSGMSAMSGTAKRDIGWDARWDDGFLLTRHRSEEHTSELQSLMRTSYAVFCLKKKNNIKKKRKDQHEQEVNNTNYDVSTTKHE